MYLILCFWEKANLRRNVLLASWFAKEVHGTRYLEWQPWQALYLGTLSLAFFWSHIHLLGFWLIDESRRLLDLKSLMLAILQWWVKVTLKKETKKKKEFQKPIFWNLTPCELDLVHLRRPRICISETRSSVSFVVYGLWTTWGNIFHTFLWFFKNVS